MPSNKKYYDDNGNLITSPAIIRMIEMENKIPNDLRFPNMTHRLSGSDELTKTEWFPKYITIRNNQDDCSSQKYIDWCNTFDIDTKDDIDKFRGALIGAAIGDALGTTLEFKPKGTFAPINDIVGGGPFNLQAGEWTDDTSMMYCLAHSLVRKNVCDLKDQMELYTKWWKDGVFSVNGKCFDIGNTVVSALRKFAQTGNPMAGDTHPMSAGNGSLMRLAPIPIRYYNNFDDAVKNAALSSITTHGATEAVDACRYFSGLIWGALHGESKETLLDGIYSPIEGYWENNPLCESISQMLIIADYKTKTAKQIRASGYVMHSLEAVLWAFFHNNDFESGALAAVNLGEDADTTGAIYGQLAGAYYGERKIPFKWINKIKKNYVFYLKALELKEIVISE